MDSATKSAEINELAAALSVAQGSMKFATKDSTNPHYKSDYADLASVWEAIRKPLSDNGLAVSQLPMGDHLHTLLMHKSGQWVSSETPIKCQVPTNPQAYGSGLTYARRYALAAITGITQGDDDGNAASGAHDQKPANSYYRPAPDDSYPPDIDSASQQRERIAAAQGTKPSRPTIIEANRLTTAIQTCEKVHNPKTGKSYLQCTFILHDPAMGRGQEGRASVFENKGKPGFIETVMAHKGEYVEYEIEKKESNGKQYINIVGIIGKVSE
jgi:hypothetical protein